MMKDYVIPKKLLEDQTVTSNGKILYSIIRVVCEENGGVCTLTNIELAEKMGLTKDTISKLITLLVRRGYLKNEVVKTQRNQVLGRKLYIA